MPKLDKEAEIHSHFHVLLFAFLANLLWVPVIVPNQMQIHVVARVGPSTKLARKSVWKYTPSCQYFHATILLIIGEPLHFDLHDFGLF